MRSHQTAEILPQVDGDLLHITQDPRAREHRRIVKDSAPWAPDQGHPVWKDGCLVFQPVQSLLTCKCLKILEFEIDASFPSGSTGRLEVAINEEDQIVEGAAALSKVSGEAGKQMFEFVKVAD